MVVGSTQKTYRKEAKSVAFYTFSKVCCGFAPRLSELLSIFAAGFPKESGCIGLYRSKITNNGPKMLKRNEIEIPHKRGRTMSLSEVLEEMFGFNPNAIDEERNDRKYSTEVQNTK